jgi:hypothetical protein
LASKTALGLARRGDPSYVHLREGLPAFADVPFSARAGGDYSPDPSVVEAFAAGKGGQYDLGTSFNYLTGQAEPGISTYGALRFPKGIQRRMEKKNTWPFGRPELPGAGRPQWLMRSAPDVSVTRPLPKDAPYRSLPGRAGATSYTINPYLSQASHIGQVQTGRRTGTMYEMTGLNVLGRPGSDLEPLVRGGQGAIKKAVGIDPSDIWLNPQLTKAAGSEFAKFDRFGNRILTPFERSMQGARLGPGSSAPWTSSFRAAAQTAPNLEEEYQRTAPRLKSAARGGPRAPGEGLFNPISPSI